MNADLQTVAERLAAATGMDARALDANRLQWIVEARCRDLKLANLAEYKHRLDRDVAEVSTEELDRLIEDVVIQETRFFRDAAVFDHLRQTLTQLAATSPGPLRLLSAPCGTGQEPYSLAAAAQQVGLLDRITIDAIDISVNALATARRGIYPAQAFVSLTPELQTLLATMRSNKGHIHPALRDRIHFERRNLADPAALPSEPTYHLILCRNLFIYLHPAARKALAQSLSRVLLPGGRLILGSADNVEELSTRFAPTRPAAAFAFTHRIAKAVDTVAAIASKTIRRTTPARPIQESKPAEPKTKASAKGAPINQNDGTSALYVQALHQQHLGNLRRSERLCRQALYLSPTDLPAMELLQTLWHQQPNQRLRHALTARILRTRTPKETA